MNIPSLIRLATAEAQRLQAAGPQASSNTPDLSQAVAAVWAMVKPRLALEDAPACEQLDLLIERLTGAAAPPATSPNAAHRA